MVLDRSLVQPGMEVVGSDFTAIGKVAEVNTRYFVVQHPRLLRSPEIYYVPRDAIGEVSEAEHRVVLTLTADAFQGQSWSSPPD